MGRIAIVCASGVGDALLFYGLAPLLHRQGWEITAFSNHLANFGSWLAPLGGLFYAPQPEFERIEEIFDPFDAIFLQHDNSSKSFKIKTLSKKIYGFYGTHLFLKHGSLNREQDYLCDRTKSMVENVSLAAERFFGQKIEESGFLPPATLIHRRFAQRIAIHPTCSTAEKRWPPQKFRSVANILEKEGWEPVFTVAPSELAEWEGSNPTTFLTPKQEKSVAFPNLESLASFIYESGFFFGNDSGTGHLASLLNIPHLIIGGTGLQMPLWKTGWHSGELITAPKQLMYFKMLRPHWEKFITIKKVIKKLRYMILRN